MPSRSHDSFVAEQFSPSADAYVVSAVHARGEDLEALSGLVGVRAGAAALDLGCGGGHLAFAFAPLAPEVAAATPEQATLLERQIHDGLRDMLGPMLDIGDRPVQVIGVAAAA